MLENVPEEMLSLKQYSEDISILIGENGSGKSTLLNNLSKHFLDNGKDVVAIATSVHDKFEVGHRKFKTLRGRSGRRQTRSTIKNSLQNVAEGTIQILKNISQALRYVNFDPVVGFRIEDFHSNSFGEIITESDLNQNDKEKLIYLLERTLSLSRHEDDIIWLEADNFSMAELDKSALTELILWEGKLKQLKIIDRIEVFLRRNNNIISMLDASSGELVLITSIVYLSTVITENTVILIDEPENSLHPKWQKEYAKIVFDIFYRYQPKVIIATHSPLVINGAELFIENTKVYKSENFTFELQKKEPLNLEELYFRFFDVTTPQNRFLSDRIIRLLNLLANGKIQLNAFENELAKIETNSYDPKQIDVLHSIREIGSEIATQTPGS